jgi:hypothetical protein
VIAYASRAIPWTLVLVCSAVATVAMALVAAWPRVVWPLEGAAVGLLAGAAAWSMDEVTAEVVDAAPRPLWWRTAARALGLVPLALAWVGSVLVARQRLPPHAGLFLLQGLAAIVLAVAFVAWRRGRGEAAPGARIGAAAIGVATTWALIRPFPDRVPVFPIWEFERWGTSLALWSAVACASVALLVAVLGSRG